MGIYIKGIELPTDNTVLIRVFPASENGECYVQQLDVDGDILTELWAVPVPPHGRLIDADEFERLECNACDGACEMVDCDCINCDADCRCDFMLDIRAVPTIIPAEEGE